MKKETNNSPQFEERGATSRRGFASMTPERQRQIASMGGKAVPPGMRTFSRDRELASLAGYRGGKSVPAAKRSFTQDPELARRAGALGGTSVGAERRSFSVNPKLAAEAGRKGGKAPRRPT